MKRYLIISLLLWVLSPGNLQAQIATDPVLPVANKKVTVTFDSSKEPRLGLFTGDLYAHTGVIIEGSTEWKHVIGTWNNNSLQPKLTHKGSGIYELVVQPDINAFYSVPGTEKVRKLAFVFRSSDGLRQTNDFLVDVFEEGLVISITSPSEKAIIEKGVSFTISATSSQDATLKLLSSGNILAQAKGKNISTPLSLLQSGWHTIIAEASDGVKTIYDTVSLYVREPVVSQTRPQTTRKGINYLSPTSVSLVLWAPGKQFAYVLGDFNDWKLNESFQMKKDGEFFWLDVSGLTPGTPYVFQYYIDGQVMIADPYANQTSDPNDQYISSVTYPGLVPYRTGKAEGIASVLKTGQVPYNWTVTDFVPSPVDRLVIYELLIRDFTEEHTYQSVIDKLDYLKSLGINALELMPVNEFEGNQSWGYNPSFYFAPDKYYGPANDLKKLIDEAHKRGIAVIIDMVLNHSYGQSPFVKMYWDVSNNRPAANNPWHNVQSNFQNPSAQWGFDFNHESLATRELIDSINSFWMKEYKVDGFRFDFTKGFSNTPYGPSDWGSAYDAARIANLKRMAGEIWKRNSKALVIFEHLSDNSEEKELAEAGILLWGNLSGAYGEAAKGNTADLSWGLAGSRGWNKPHLVTYFESHDEERIMVKLLKEGGSEGTYNTRFLPTALDRTELSSLFLFPLPGPKMIWQFGELGYDYSINSCENPNVVSPDCRLTPKPILWSYYAQPNRLDLYKMVGRLNYLKTNYGEFSSTSAYAGSLGGVTKWYRLSDGNNHVVVAGNFATSSRVINLSFPSSGTWNEYFSGSTLNVSGSQMEITLAPGEFRLYSTRKFQDPFTGTSSSVAGLSEKREFYLWPNPARDKVTLESSMGLEKLEILNLSGVSVMTLKPGGIRVAEIGLEALPDGLYLVRVTQDGMESVTKMVIRKN